jgi:hypothetical protein
MRIPGRSSVWGWLSVVLIAGCSKTPIHPPGTGSKEAAQIYFEALIRREWEQAYSILDAGSKARCNKEQFSCLAQNYRNSLGFEPEGVQVRAYDEQGAQATVHVVLTGHAATKDRRYKDAITLRRDDDGWHVVMPQNFGQATER